MAQPNIEPIPEFRMNKPLSTFSVIGLDFKSQYKQYMVIVTCLQVRAVYIKMVYSLEAGSYTMLF